MCLRKYCWNLKRLPNILSIRKYFLCPILQGILKSIGSLTASKGLLPTFVIQIQLCEGKLMISLDQSPSCVQMLRHCYLADPLNILSIIISTKLKLLPT